MRGRRGKKKFLVRPWMVIAVLLVLLFFIIRPYLGNKDGIRRGAKVPDGKWTYAVDLSSYNDGKIVWDSLYVALDNQGRTTNSILNAKSVTPVDLVIIKATEGLTMHDPCFRKFWKAAGESEVKRAAYHFFRSSKDPVQQAYNFIHFVGDLRYSDYPPVLDLETIHRGCSHDQLNERALVWLNIVQKRYGRKPIVYTSDNFATQILSPEITEHYPIWVAHYNTPLPDYEGWMMWQFTEKALVYGIQREVDLSVIQDEDH